MKEFLTLDDVKVGGKTVFLRVDINAPVDEKTKKITSSNRIEAHAKTIKELSEKNAKVVVLAHQGRPGSSDFIPLNQHDKLLEKYVGKKINYVDDIFGSNAQNSIKSLKDGEILLLENLRFFSEEQMEKTSEEHAQNIMIKNLAPLGDLFVNDAFSAAHRAHVSMVGFAEKLKTIAGRVMEYELTSLQKAMENPQRPSAFILGGAKPEDSIKVMAHSLGNETLDYAIVCGIVGQLFVKAAGYDLGKKTEDFMDKKGYLKFLGKCRDIYEKYKDHIILPVDLAVDKDGVREEVDLDDLPSDYSVLDIGKKSGKKIAEILKKSKSIMINGPAGVYEDDKFAKGTKMILDAISESDGFSLVGGGHTISAIDKLGMDVSKFSYISLAGGALIRYLTGKTFPIAQEFKKYAK